MKKLLFVFFIIFQLSNSFAQNKNVRIYFDQKQFFNPELGNYIELQFQFVAQTIKYQKTEAGLIGTLGINIVISQNDSIVYKEGYRLDSPIFKDEIIEDFYDIKRYALKPGEYKLNLTIFDANTDAEEVKAETKIRVEDFASAISLSDIEIAEYAKKSDQEDIFYKSGYTILPRMSNYYPKELNFIPVYIEIYNTGLLEDTVFGIKQTLINNDSKIEMADFSNYTILKKSEVVPYLRNIDISKLPTGNYDLNFKIITKSMKELSEANYTFDRTNDIEEEYAPEKIIIDPAFQASISSDSVQFYLESLIPISKPAEVRNIIKISKSKVEEDKRKYIQSYWSKTAPGSSYDSWIRYKNQVILVEKIYRNNFQEGFETDRGRVYLQYGAPTNIITKEVSANEYPYEIWVYNKIEKFSNKRFIFYNPDLTNNAYRLLHSDMIGELKNPSWPSALSKRSTAPNNVDDPNGNKGSNFGDQSEDLFRQY